jgi:hypothetical protein
MDRLKVFRAIDKLDRLGAKAVLELLTVGRRDKSGDFIKGAGLGMHAACFIMDSIGVKAEVLCYRPETGFAMVYVDG